MRGIIVGVDDDDRALHAGAGATEFFGEAGNIPELDRLSLQQILPAGADRNVDLVGTLQLLFGVGARQIDLQLRELGIGRRQHQKDDDYQQNVDHRNQVDFRIFLELAGELHTRACGGGSRSKRSPWTTSTSRAACCSISTTKVSTLPRK